MGGCAGRLNASGRWDPSSRRRGFFFLFSRLCNANASRESSGIELDTEIRVWVCDATGFARGADGEDRVAVDLGYELRFDDAHCR